MKPSDRREKRKEKRKEKSKEPDARIPESERDRVAVGNVERRRGAGRTDGPGPKKERPRDTDPEHGAE